MRQGLNSPLITVALSLYNGETTSIVIGREAANATGMALGEGAMMRKRGEIIKKGAGRERWR